MSSKGFLIAGTQSGAGKTTITLGLMAALRKKGLRVVPFKCGPDFIDPSLHKLVTGCESRNLDLWMAGEEFSLKTYSQQSLRGDISVIEGVMGMFDGGISSSAALARRLDIPVILVLDVRSAAESGAAVLKGFEILDPEVAPRGVILNMVGSERHYQLVKDAIEQHCSAEILGYLPRNIDFSVPSRHLGLHMGEEQPISHDSLEKLTEVIIEQIDLERLLELAGEVESHPREADANTSAPAMRMAVARDKAFCFYYDDNLDIFRQSGCEIAFFSPLEDKRLPENIQAVYLGGGYPELYGEKLSRNKELLEEIHRRAEDGLPVYAECGGFMYLTEGISDLEGNFHPLVSIFPTRAAMQTRRASLGYRELTTREESYFGPAGTVLRGHEFHYSKIEPLDMTVERIYDVGGGRGGGGEEGYRYKNVIGGYMHLHFGFNRDAVHNFIQYCKEEPCQSPFDR